MRYWWIFFLLSLVLFSGICVVAGCLNEQLSCQAAPVIDIRVSEDNVQLSVLNSACFFNTPSFLKDFINLQFFEIGRECPQLVKDLAGELKDKVVTLGQEVYSLGKIIWSNIRNKIDSGEG